MKYFLTVIYNAILLSLAHDKDSMKGLKLHILVRAAIPQDAQAIAKIIKITHYEEANPQQIERLITQGNHFTWVAVADDIVGFVDGFITVSQNGITRGEIDLISVHSEYSGQSIGKQLIRTFSENVQNIDIIRALVAVDNTPMHRAIGVIDYQLNPQTQSLYIASENGENIVSPLESYLIPVETFTYSGIWLEGEISKEAIQSAQFQRKKRGYDVVGAVIPTQNAEAIKTVQNAGFEHVKDFQWWIKHNP